MRTFVSAFGKTDSKHTRGAVVQLVRMPACHAGGRGFESLPHRREITIIHCISMFYRYFVLLFCQRFVNLFLNNEN